MGGQQVGYGTQGHTIDIEWTALILASTLAASAYAAELGQLLCVCMPCEPKTASKSVQQSFRRPFEQISSLSPQEDRRLPLNKTLSAPAGSPGQPQCPHAATSVQKAWASADAVDVAASGLLAV